MAMALFILYFVFTLIALYRSFHPRVWEIGSGLYLCYATFIDGLPWIIGIVLWAAVIFIIAILELEPLRLKLSNYFYNTAGKSVPKLSKTEEEALNAGDPWFEKDIFMGTPDWERLASINTELTPEEQSFLDNETEVLCSMIDDWETSQTHDLPAKVWTYLKENGYFGLVIPKEYGGKGFSGRAHSDIVMKIASRSGAAAVTVMVPNSLGPGELLNYYGTDEQKSYYLPRLAKGVEIPCFALTEPNAGSDATSIQSDAIVVKRKISDKEVLGLSITLDKRWITLAPVATLIGLAVKLKDPDGLLQGVGKEGITCLLIPRDTENLEIGNRHIPANQAFMNGTLRGKDIFVPITTIIGGQEKAGCGWQMLVECLSIGRSISLPALSAASSSISYLTTGAFARIRRQFNVEIGQFEGVEEKLAEIAGLNYLINATRLLTVAAINEHKKPSVASAITKYFNTELSRITVISAMDIHAGRAVVNGPRNYLANLYQSLPIAITVEGANVMSRNLLIFGQGSIVCHPYIRDEFYAVSQQNKDAFHKIIWQHIHYFMHNFAKAVCSAWTGGRLIGVPNQAMRRDYQRLTRLSHAFAWLADFSLITLGGDLKRKERLSARLADGLSYLYMAMGVLRSVQLNQSDSDEQLHAQWALAYCFFHAQKSLISLCNNFPAKWLGRIVKWIAFPFGQTMQYPSDKLEHELAKMMRENNHYRNRIKQYVYLSGDSQQPVDRMENALQLIIRSKDLVKKVADLKGFKNKELSDKLHEKMQNKEITQQELDELLALEEARWDAILVDEFPFDSLKKKTFHSKIDSIESPLL